MRLLQIDPNGSETTALDFHPMVTVVTGLTPSGRDIVLRVARALAQAQDPGSGGLIEAHGVLLDLNRETLELLELQADLNVLVADEDLPKGAIKPDTEVNEPSAAPSGQPRGPGDIENFIQTTPVGVSEDLDKARRRRADRREALTILQEPAAKAQTEFEKVLSKQKVAEAELAAAKEASAPKLRLVVNEESDSAEPAEPKIDPREIYRQRAELLEKIEQLEERVASINRGLEELSAIDTRPLSVLLDAIRNPQPIEYVPSERANELADEVIDLERKVANLEKELDKRGLASGQALKQLELSRLEVANAEKAMRKPELTKEDVSVLEKAHEDVLEAETKAGGAFKRGGQKKLEQALAQQQEILDRIGFPTWSAYVMGAGLLAIDHTAEQRVEKARLDLEAADSHWASVCAEIEANPGHRQLLDRLEDVYLEAFDLLGGAEPEDLETALRELQVPKREVTTEELVEALNYQLELAGLQLPDGAGTDFTIVAAEAFIDEASAVEGRINELRDERVTANAELSVASGRLNELAAIDLSAFDDDPSAADGDGDEDTSKAADRDALDPSDPFGLGGLYEEGQEPDDDGEVEELERAVEEALEEVAEYTEWVESREALVDAALTIETVSTSRLVKIATELMDDTDLGTDRNAGDASDGGAFGGGAAGSNGNSARTGPPRVEDVERYLLDRFDEQQHVSYAGSVPVVLNDALRELEPADVRRVLDQLQTVSESVQLIYLTDDVDVAGWAEEVGFQRAAVVPAPIGFG